jgi:RHS repeat-associated protein
VTAADHSFQTDESYSWDNNGNRNSSGYTVGTNNRISTDGTYNYTYDDEGNVTRRTKISDNSVRDYTWDYRNRLTSVVDRTSAGGTITMQADYTYDVFDRRLKRVVDADGAGGGAAVTSRYVFEGAGPNVTLQFDGSNNLTHRYLWGEALDQLLADENSSNAIAWSLADHLGTVRDVVNNSGTVQNHLKWDSFGAVTSESAPAVDFLMGFAGTLRDEETGHNYAWHRYLQDGRWLSEDPEGFDVGDMNLRRYVGNGPIMHTDRTGLRSPLPNEEAQINNLKNLLTNLDTLIGLQTNELKRMQLEVMRSHINGKLNQFMSNIARQPEMSQQAQMMYAMSIAIPTTQADGPILPFGDIAAVLGMAAASGVIYTQVQYTNQAGQMNAIYNSFQDAYIKMQLYTIQPQIQQMEKELDVLHLEEERLQIKLDGIQSDSQEQIDGGGIGEGYVSYKTEMMLQMVQAKIGETAARLARLKEQMASGGE